MKRIGYLYEKILAMDNLILAEEHARKNKKKNGHLPYGVRRFDLEKQRNLENLQRQLIDCTFHTSEYKVMTIHADHGKIREIFKLPYFPDRILHHAILNVIGPILKNTLIYDTYACVEGKGTAFGVSRVKEALKDRKGTEWFLKVDVKKFYPTIDQNLTMVLLRRVFKDERLLLLLDDIVYSTPAGLPIGLYTSQPIANFVLSPLDHYIKEQLRVKYYFRYCDDMLFLSDSKEKLESIFEEVNKMMINKFHQNLHANHIIARVGAPIPHETLRDRRMLNQRPADRLPRLSVHARKGASSQVDEKEICPKDGKSKKQGTPSRDHGQLQGLVHAG